jgi:transposase-like protein
MFRLGFSASCHRNSLLGLERIFPQEQLSARLQRVVQRTLTYEFPAEHWAHLRTTNPIESTFATIRLRHRRTKGSGSRRTSLAMMFKLAQSAAKRWRRLRSHEMIVHVVEGRSFVDGIMQEVAA